MLTSLITLSIALILALPLPTIVRQHLHLQAAMQLSLERLQLEGHIKKCVRDRDTARLIPLASLVVEEVSSAESGFELPISSSSFLSCIRLEPERALFVEGVEANGKIRASPISRLGGGSLSSTLLDRTRFVGISLDGVQEFRGYIEMTGEHYMLALHAQRRSITVTTTEFPVHRLLVLIPIAENYVLFHSPDETLRYISLAGDTVIENQPLATLSLRNSFRAEILSSHTVRITVDGQRDSHVHALTPRLAPELLLASLVLP